MNRFRLFCTIVLSSCLALQAQAQEAQPTTWLIVRHADRAGAEDAVTTAGEKRAEQLAQIAKLLRVQAVYSTDFQRTRRTAEPTAEAMNLEITTYGGLNDDWFQELKARHAGQVVLIVGHSNTVGSIVNGLGVAGDFPIAEDEFDNLFVVATSDSGFTSIRLKYGDPSASKVPDE